MLDELRKLLLDNEKVVAGPVFGIAPEELDPRESSLEERNGFLLFRSSALDNRHCPFELHFGRGEHIGRFNFFVGRGAEFANYEPLTDAASLVALRSDVQRFLLSTIDVESHCMGDEVVKERYVANKLVVGGQAIRLVYKGRKAGLFAKLTKQHHKYTPWVATQDAAE